MSAHTQIVVISQKPKLLQGHQDKLGQSPLTMGYSWKLQQEVMWSKGGGIFFFFPFLFSVSLCHQQMGINGQQGRVLTELSFRWEESKEWMDRGGKQEDGGFCGCAHEQARKRSGGDN